MSTTSKRELAAQPEDLARLVVERVQAGDAEGVAALYEPDAVLGYPAGQTTVGREAIGAVYQELITAGAPFQLEKALVTLRIGDIALTATRPADGAGCRSQVARRQPDGTWLRILDRPEARGQ